MQKTSRFSRLLTLVTAVALAVCLPVSAYAETETTEEAAAPAVVEEAAQDNTADEAASEDSASCVRVVDVTIFMDTTKGHFESDPDNVALTYLNRAEFEETPITLPTVIANEGWEFKGWDVWGKEHFVLGADATELGTSGLGAFPVGSLVGGIYLYPIFMEAPKPVEPTATPVEPTATPVEPTATPVEPTCYSGRADRYPGRADCHSGRADRYPGRADCHPDRADRYPGRDPDHPGYPGDHSDQYSG